MFVTLDAEAVAVLRCPLCKAHLQSRTDSFVCELCASTYGTYAIDTGSGKESIYDFRIHRPSYCCPAGWSEWDDKQDLYEDTYRDLSNVDNYDTYAREISGVATIYTEQFVIAGKVLDVGGNIGKLRHFLTDAVSLYVSVDPYLNILSDMALRRNLLKAYPCLHKPLNFLAGCGESLPLAEGSFDWVHMRSVLDHFYDPWIVLKEARRLLKPGGRLLIGLRVAGALGSKQGDTAVQHRIASTIYRARTKLRQEGIPGLCKGLAARIRSLGREPDDHMWHWTYANLKDVLLRVGFAVEKEYWQQSCRYDPSCIYVSARRDTPPEIGIE